MQRLTYLLRWVNIILILLTLLAYLSPVVSPVTFWPLSFFGLFYPWLLLGNILFVLLWLARGKRYFLFSFACILLGWHHLTGLVSWQAGDAPPPTEGESLTVMSYNIHRFLDIRNGNRLLDPAPFLQLLKENKVEVLCLQEFSFHRPDWTADLKKRMAEEAGLQYEYTGDRGGMAVFSVFPLKNTGTVYSNRANGYQYADLVLPGGSLRLYNLHLHSNHVSDLADRVAAEGNLQEKETWLDIKGMLARYKRATRIRAKQAEELAAHIDAAALPVILCGDLNDIPQSYSYALLNRRLLDTFREKGSGLATTYAGKIPGLRIDYILVSPELTVRDFRTGRHSFSDHRPVWTELQIPTR